jgi:hypothetical protein
MYNWHQPHKKGCPQNHISDIICCTHHKKMALHGVDNTWQLELVVGVPSSNFTNVILALSISDINFPFGMKKQIVP